MIKNSIDISCYKGTAIKILGVETFNYRVVRVILVVYRATLGITYVQPLRLKPSSKLVQMPGETSRL